MIAGVCMHRSSYKWLVHLKLLRPWLIIVRALWCVLVLKHDWIWRVTLPLSRQNSCMQNPLQTTHRVASGYFHLKCIQLSACILDRPLGMVSGRQWSSLSVGTVLPSAFQQHCSSEDCRASYQEGSLSIHYKSLIQTSYGTLCSGFQHTTSLVLSVSQPIKPELLSSSWYFRLPLVGKPPADTMQHKKDDRKRKREDGSQNGPTVGQLTSHIANKQVRSAQYEKLKHKAKVC